VDDLIHDEAEEVAQAEDVLRTHRQVDMRSGRDVTNEEVERYVKERYEDPALREAAQRPGRPPPPPPPTTAAARRRVRPCGRVRARALTVNLVREAARREAGGGQALRPPALYRVQ